MRLPILSFMCFQSQVMATQLNKFDSLQEQSSNEKKLKESSEKLLLAENINAVVKDCNNNEKPRRRL